MTTAMTMRLGGANSYVVSMRDGCTLVDGAMPVDHFVALSKGSPGAVVSAHLARLAGANMAWGSPDDVEALTLRLTERALARVRTPLEQWLAAGERGASSNAIVSSLRGVPVDDSTAHPHDPDDLRRCRLLLEAVPELATDLPRMAAVSPAWAALVGQWQEMCALMDAEAPNWRTGEIAARRTYALMRDVLGAAA